MDDGVWSDDADGDAAGPELRETSHGNLEAAAAECLAFLGAADPDRDKENLGASGRAGAKKPRAPKQRRAPSLRIDDNKPDVEKPFVCQFPGCNKRFALRGYLRQHQICHSDARPFKCAHCDAAFARRYQLRVHERARHTNERPYKCTHPGCDKSFTTASSALDHVRRYGTGCDCTRGAGGRGRR